MIRGKRRLILVAKLLRIEERALQLIREKGYIDYDFLSRRLGVPPVAAKRVVDHLVERGLLVPEECDCGKCPLASVCPYAGRKSAKTYRLRLRGAR